MSYLLRRKIPTLERDRPLPALAPPVGQAPPHPIGRKPLTFRPRSKRRARNPICFSPSVFLPDTVSGLFVNRPEFGALV
jgi:insertion element IS1 protein InsB